MSCPGGKCVSPLPFLSSLLLIFRLIKLCLAFATLRHTLVVAQTPTSTASAKFHLGPHYTKRMHTLTVYLEICYREQEPSRLVVRYTNGRETRGGMREGIGTGEAERMSWAVTGGGLGYKEDAEGEGSGGGGRREDFCESWRRR